jgi:hypothetical protein
VPIPRWNFLQNIRIWSQYAPDSLGKFNGSWLHSTATSDRVIFLGYFNNGTFLNNQMAIAYLPMKPFDEPDFGRYLPLFGSGGFAAGTPLSTQMIKNQKRKEKTNFKMIKIIIIRKRK